MSQKIEATDTLMLPAQAGAMVNKDKGFMLRAARAKQIDVVRLGTKTLRFRKSDVLKFIERHVVAAFA